MAQKGQKGTRAPRVFKPFHVPADVKALKEYGSVIQFEIRAAHARVRDSFNRHKKVG